jgi:hypothetical protein
VSANVWLTLLISCTLLLIAPGRLGSADALAQLQAATLLARTGDLGISPPPSALKGVWIPSPSGRYFEAHDPGNLLLMTPAAFGAGLLDRRPLLEAVVDPPPSSKLFVSLAMAVLAGAGAILMQRTVWQATNRSGALASGAILLFGTFAIAYARSAWDVLGGWVGVIWVTKVMVEMATSPKWTARQAAELGLAAAFACWFRYSLGPFLGLTLLWWFWSERSHVTRKAILGCVAAGGLAMIPVLYYNYVRMGSFWIPATRHPQFDSVNALGGHAIDGVLALVFSPNRGLLAHAPVLLLLPWAMISLRRSTGPRIKRLLLCLIAPCTLYLGLIGSMNNPCAFGWGPRYLLPILPILALPVLILLADRQNWTLSVYTLVGVSLVINAPAALANWSAAGAQDGVLAIWSWPQHQAATWNQLGQMLHHIQLSTPDPPGQTAAGGPDFWWWRLFSLSPMGAIVSTLSLIGLVTVVLMVTRRLVSSLRRSATPDWKDSQ